MLYCANSRYKCFVALGSFNDCLIWTRLQGNSGFQFNLNVHLFSANMEVKVVFQTKPVHAVLRKLKNVSYVWKI